MASLLGFYGAPQISLCGPLHTCWFVLIHRSWLLPEQVIQERNRVWPVLKLDSHFDFVLFVRLHLLKGRISKNSWIFFKLLHSYKLVYSIKIRRLTSDYFHLILRFYSSFSSSRTELLLEQKDPVENHLLHLVVLTLKPSSVWKVSPSFLDFDLDAFEN